MVHCVNYRLFCFLICAFCILAARVEADERLQLSKPIGCHLGTDCWIVNLVDRDAGPGVQDFKCSSYSYDGHKGIDIAIRDLAAMDDGVVVLAAAAGTVKGTRNHMDDIDVNKLKESAWAGNDCGNGLVIQHDGNWETQYCHLRRGSVQVTSGQQIAVGEILGYVGSSGRSEFPHLHLSVRHDGQVIDPFTADSVTADTLACGVTVSVNTLWDDSFVMRVADTMTAIYNTGFAPAAANPVVARAGQYNSKVLDDRSPAISFWADLFWVSENDQIIVRILGPEGELLGEYTDVPPRQQGRRFVKYGKKRETNRWPTGVYVGEVRLIRTREDGSVIEFFSSSSITVQ